MKDPMRNFPSHGSRRDDFHDFPLMDADQCVKCGLCLPHCPTYKLSHHEGDSPRGRIALMQGLAQGVIEPGGSALPHLDGCLVCRACEPVCPADVPYGRLIDSGRAGLWRTGHRPGWLWRMLASLRRTPRRLAWLGRCIRFVHTSRIAMLMARLPLGRAKRAARYLQASGRSPAPGTYPPGAQPDAALFLGCVARSLDAATLHATIQVLNAMGFAVHVPSTQTCCGAMDAHAGDRRTATQLAQANLNAFTGEIPIISNASGCGVQLHDYPELPGLGADAQRFSTHVVDVMHFIAAHANRLPALAPLHARAVVHAPCTLRNGMRQDGALDVLASIPGLTVAPLRHRDCCGAAGSYLFEHSDNADQLGARLLDALGSDIPDIFVTSNIGCALHVRRLAAERGLDMLVRHPVELLAASLAVPADGTAQL